VGQGAAEGEEKREALEELSQKHGEGKGST